MHSALTPLIRFIFRTLLSLLLIAVILAGGRFLLDQGRALRASSSELQALTGAQASIAAYRTNLSALARARMHRAQTESLAEIDARIAQASIELAASEKNRDVSVLSFPLRGTGGLAQGVSSHYQYALMAQMTRQELDYLQQLRAYLVSNRGLADQRLEQLRLKHVAAYAQYLQLKNVVDHPGLAERVRENFPAVFGASPSRQRLAGALAANNQAARDYASQKALIASLQAPTFLVDQSALDAVTKVLSERLEQAGRAVTQNWFARYVGPVVQLVPLALLVLLSSFATHLIVKLLFYYVLAPLAARRKPIQLEPPAPAPTPAVQASASKVSQEVRLEPGEELLVLPEFLQSSSTSALKSTKWLLDWSCPWTSLVSGMVMLTRVRTSSRDDHVVVSSDADAVSELALVTLPAGAAMVFQPHGLVGVIYPTATPLTITQHWRLFSAHAWLTMQLRYLIFRGPVTLIVKGTRGVHSEPAGQGRIISQYATLGFSSHLQYATIRSETFLPYYQNRTPLLQDKFEGENGYYVYDETPRYGNRGGFFSRGLEGLADAVLKVFGI